MNVLVIDNRRTRRNRITELLKERGDLRVFSYENIDARGYSELHADVVLVHLNNPEAEEILNDCYPRGKEGIVFFSGGLSCPLKEEDGFYFVSQDRLFDALPAFETIMPRGK